jgi:transcriptional regulator with XRE-family HTH domain
LTPNLGPDLKARRTAAGLTQNAVADQLGVSRPTITQWERDVHRPSPEHIIELDRLYGARGALIRLAEGGHPADQSEAPRSLYVADVFRSAADALVDAVVEEKSEGLGWPRNLASGAAPGPLGTAYVLRTLQLLDDARVDLDRVGDFLKANQRPRGWGYRASGDPRPEVTAVVLAALAHLGRLPKNALDMLGDLVDNFAKSRPFVLAVALEAVLGISPEDALVNSLTQDLLRSRIEHEGHMLWPMNSSALERTVPSLAHTARATAILRLARPTTSLVGPVDEAIGSAVDWMSSPHKGDVGVIEVLEVAETRPAIPNHHFTSAWVIRALAGVKGVPASRLQAALDVLWESYSLTDRLWIWRDEGSLPSWMTHDAISALRATADVSVPSPFSTTSRGDDS